ncbi:GPO family capsid scaffolding protein [uncultured Sphingomonas sp.]|uniref:GPO family capsid scaffolding protein n=1 Tax=uncultured Sphingomonas sp. TaxID=158754 RepID=UPI0025F9D124|nr:GPO family capsid scaffolding protein [uncultured Sphingomonas sp.]
MGKKSKLFRVFVAGNTISDGRTITPEMIDEIVETFNAEAYTPRINVEHIAGYSPEPPFNGYGDVIAVEARDDAFTIAGKAETRRALYAQVDANDQLVGLTDRGQKPFPSVELTPDYAGTGKIGLIGLAFTDKPASIGTQKLQFSRSAPGTVFAAGTDAAAIEFEGDPVNAASITNAIAAGFAKVGEMFKAKKEEPKPPIPPVEKEPANDNFAAAITALGEAVAAAIKPVAEAQAKTDAAFAELKTQLAAEPQGGSFTRSPATGAAVDAKFATDC